jgi:hypothetical protein
MVKSKKVPAGLDNKYILYVVFLASFASLVGYLLKEDYVSVVAFVLAALALRTITCNMIIVLGIPLVGVALMKARVKEGMTDEEEEKKKNVKKPTRENLVAKSSPAAVDEDNDAADSVSRVDFATTMKQAYEDLQDVLDKDGIKALSKETQQLVEQQKALMSSLNTMAPILKDAKSSLQGFNIPDIKNMIASLKQ